MKFKALTSKTRYVVLGLIGLEIASIPVAAQIMSKVAFTKPQIVNAVPFPPEQGVSKFLVASDAPFVVVSENSIGEFDINIRVSGLLNGNHFGANAQAPGALKSCAVQTENTPTKIYVGERETAARDGEILTRAVIVEIRYAMDITPELKIVSQNAAKKIAPSHPCEIKTS